MRLDSRAAIACREFLHKKFAPDAFPGLTPDPVDPVTKEFSDQGFAHEARAIDALFAANSGVIQIDQSKTLDQIQIETALALLNPDAFMIIGSYIGEITERELFNKTGRAFATTQRASRPDLIVKVGQHKDDRPAWAPIDIKSHKAFKESKSNTVFVSPIVSILPTNQSSEEARLIPEDLHQLAHYTRHFQALDIGNDELWVGIIGRDLETCAWMRISDAVLGSGKSQASVLDDHDTRFNEALEVARLSEIENKDLSQKAGVISINSTGKMGCTMCKYKLTCLDEMKRFDNGNGHVTLLAGVTPKVNLEEFPEIQSIRELREQTPTNDAMIKAQVRARVWETKVPELLDPSTPFEIPEFDVEIDIDLENSLEALRELEIDEPLGIDRLYLYGFGIHDRTIDKDWRSANIDTFSDYSNTEAGEFEVMLKMWNRLQEKITKAGQANKSIGIFHYSSHEFTWWKNFARRFAGKPGVPTMLEVQMFKSSYLVDLLPYARRISFPTMDNSIKSLAPLAKFDWSVDMAGGANSLFKYRAAINRDLDDATRQQAREWLDSYNRDDVKATFALRNYMRELNL